MKEKKHKEIPTTKMSKKALKRKRERRLITSMAIVSVLCVLCIIILIINNTQTAKESGSSDTSDEAFGMQTANDILNGSYVYETNTIYDFDGEKYGCMYLLMDGEEYQYGYQYTVNGNQLFIDFNAEELHDASYTFSIDGDRLTLEGGEGTTGGVYELEKGE